MAQYQLPRDFFFGAAMSGPQTEGQWNQGGKLENLWDTWSIQDLDSFYNRVGSYAGNDFMAKYQEDLRILKDLGLDTYRTSIQWSRLLDANGNLNEEGAAWYHELFRASREAGLEPFVNLYHFDMPTYLFDRGGWESREVVEAYAHYADVAFREFGQEIKYWFTFNEPIVEPEQRYQEGVWYPRLHDYNRARTVQYHISLAHALTVANYRRAYDEGARSRRRQDRHDQLLYPGLYQGEPQRGRPRGRAYDQRYQQSLVARPYYQGRASRRRARQPGRGRR